MVIVNQWLMMMMMMMSVDDKPYLSCQCESTTVSCFMAQKVSTLDPFLLERIVLLFPFLVFSRVL